MRIGVLAIQGSFSLHKRMLQSVDAEPVEVRRARELDNLNGIILPGGESTAFDIIMSSDDLGAELRRSIREGLPAWGTCAGAIILGRGQHKHVTGWGLIDIDVRRNAYGRQVDSFIAPLTIKGLTGKFDGVFIRAPIFSNAGRGVEVLAEHQGDPVMAKQFNILITSFHPELTSDSRVHEYFMEEFCQKSGRRIVKSA